MQIFAVVPAAGRSQRMGEPKLLLPWGASTVIEQVLAAWRASRVSYTVIVVHPQDDRLATIAKEAGALVVRPETPPAEMKNSVRLALEFIAGRFDPQEADAWLLAPADMPTLSIELIDQLIELHCADSLGSGGARQIRACRSNGRRGHPVLFPWPLAAQVKELGGHEGINALLARNPVEYLETPAEVIDEDLDTPEDYRRLRARYDH